MSGRRIHRVAIMPRSPAKRLTVRPLEPGDESALQSLLARYPYHDYRAYPRMPGDAGYRLLRRRFGQRCDCLAAGGVWDGDEMVAAGLLEHLAWDSKHFGRAMGRIGPLVTHAGQDAQASIDALVDWLLTRAKEARLEHIATKLDGADLWTLHVLESKGFYLVDCLTTYFYDAHRDPVPSMKQLGMIRDYRTSDLDAILSIAERMLSSYGGRFAFDRWLPREAVDRFYVEWARNACTGHMASRVLVGERHGRIVGFLGYGMESPAFESLNVRIAGHGISAVLPEGTGLYPALLAKAIVVDRLVSYDIAEFDTSIQNILPQRIFQRMGFHPARTKYALHRVATDTV